MPMILVIIDGLPEGFAMSEAPFYNDSCCENARRMAQCGAWGSFDTAPHGFAVDSLTCIGTLLGIPAQELPRGRAYLEALAGGIAVEDGDAVCRCNLVEVDRAGILRSSCGRGEAVPALPGGFRFFPMGGYKNLLVCRGWAKDAAQTRTSPPHEKIGEAVGGLLPTGSGLAERLRGFAVNSATDLGDRTLMLLPWDVTARQTLPSFEEMHSVSAGAVCAAEIVRGLALGMDMALTTPQGATAEADTDLAAKARAALSMVREHDFVLVHINGADELAHRQDTAGKQRFIARADRELLGALLREAPRDTVILVTSDHATSSATGRHIAVPQPFVLYGGGLRGDLGQIGGTQAVSLLKQAEKG